MNINSTSPFSTWWLYVVKYPLLAANALQGKPRNRTNHDRLNIFFVTIFILLFIFIFLKRLILKTK
ncbi:MAG: hypothetical protein A3B80_06295 [Elusimicrobia bacterium RIFCSPHIGHO2_02_FULL_39_36]|nr:MAG: hypothetical protein A2034_04605 [Elusimicrobia bacterium GWA2_38_7]OGR78272.1 MAG: hypothetical protein A3B80_06295 [Elusimicrobia bacterium RIFCSPHIGHO2_02_FULL_39_36]